MSEKEEGKETKNLPSAASSVNTIADNWDQQGVALESSSRRRTVSRRKTERKKDEKGLAMDDEVENAPPTMRISGMKGPPNQQEGRVSESSSRRHAASKRRTKGKKDDENQRTDEIGDGDEFCSDAESESNIPGAVRVSGMHGPADDALGSDNSFTASTSGAAPNSIDESPASATLLQAELAPDQQEEIEAAYQRGAQDQQAMLDQHTGDLRQRMENLERERKEGIALAVAKHEVEEGEDIASTKPTEGRNTCFVVVLLVVVGGIVVGALFGSGTLGSETSPLPSSPTNSPTPSPPSSSPTEFLLYDPPSLEDCVAIANNGDVEGQIRYGIFKTVDIMLNVTVDSGSYLPSLLWDLKSRIQEVISPALAGCAETERRELSPMMRGTRRNLSPTKFVVVNAWIEALYQDGRDCSYFASDGSECYGTLARMHLILKGEETDDNLLMLLENSFGGDDLVAHLFLQTTSTFQKLELESVILIGQVSDPPSSAPMLQVR